jgi:hypothetical protein
MGPGVRAVLAVSEISPKSELHTFVHDDARSDLESTMLASDVKLHIRAAKKNMSFYYKHPLARPEPGEVPDEEATATQDAPELWKVTGDTVLAFRLLEANVQIIAERAVIELSDRDREIDHRQAKKVALIAAQNDFPDLDTLGRMRDFASEKIAAHDAELLIVRTQSGGGFLFDGEVTHEIPAYVAKEWFKIGAGNVFCAMFAHYWGEKKMSPLEAAALASRSSALYASTRVLPLAGEDKLPDMDVFDSNSRCKVFVASSCNSMAQQWLVDQALAGFDSLGVDTIAPYDLGLDGIPVSNTGIADALKDCDAVLVLAEGADIPSVLAAGLARVRKLPIVVLAEAPARRRLDLWDGTDCEIAGDFASAVYRAMVAGRRRAST